MLPGHPHIVLFQPEIPQNTGSIARLAAGSGCRLHLVKPFGFSAADKNLRRAGLDYWPFLDLEVHDDLEEVLALLPQRFVFLSKKSQRPYWEIPPAWDTFVFGRETTGLPESLRERFPERFFQIPMYHPGVRSHNLANAVSAVIYERLRQLHRGEETSLSTEIQPKAPKADWLRGYVVPSLVGAPAYKIDTPNVSIKLDQNESPWDLPRPLKEKVTKRLLEMSWNRYPPAFADDLAAKVAKYAGVAPSSVLLGPGSNYLISLAISTLAKGILGGRGRLVLARPSFPLYESHSNYEGIPYSPWELNADLEYDVALLPDLTPGSMVVFASPNNPVGNVLPKKTLVSLLEQHPDTLFFADEAYFEYASEPYTDLIGRYGNLMLLRTFSKTMGAAGVRIGYYIAHPDYLSLLKKLRLPYLLNHFSLACADLVLSDPEMGAHLKAIKENAVKQRDRVYRELVAVSTTPRARV